MAIGVDSKRGHGGSMGGAVGEARKAGDHQQLTAVLDLGLTGWEGEENEQRRTQCEHSPAATKVDSQIDQCAGRTRWNHQKLPAVCSSPSGAQAKRVRWGARVDWSGERSRAATAINGRGREAG